MVEFKYKDYSNIAVITADGLYNPEIFSKQIDKDTKAVLFIVFATGTFPSNVTPKIKETIDSGIPVFFLSSNERDKS
jgi:L-asparaginase/Glu-tRNA(Gln) amidotransferase subunit D